MVKFYDVSDKTVRNVCEKVVTFTVTTVVHSTESK